MWNRLELAKRVVIFAGSLAISLWIVIRFIAMGMFGSQLDLSWQDFWMESMLWVFGGGVLAGLLWGASSLRNIFWLAVPGGALTGLMLITLPFLLIDPGEAGLAQDLLGYLSGLVLFACMACFPVLGPSISHAAWNRKSWRDMREEFGRRWTEFRSAFKNDPQWIDSPPLSHGMSRNVRPIITWVSISIILWLLSR